MMGRTFAERFEFRQFQRLQKKFQKSSSIKMVDLENELKSDKYGTAFEQLMFKQSNLRMIMDAMVDFYFEAISTGRENDWGKASHDVITLFSSKLIHNRDQLTPQQEEGV